jgi:hypothetical protein
MCAYTIISKFKQATYFKAETQCCEMGMKLVSVNTVSQDQCLRDTSMLYINGNALKKL